VTTHCSAARTSAAQTGFTLIELLIVVALLALLISILLPGLSQAREQARSVACRSNLRQLATAFLTYAAEWKDCLPGSVKDVEGTHWDTGRTWCWLGTFLGRTQIGVSVTPAEVQRYVPERGTIHPYLARDRKVYKCATARGLNRTSQGLLNYFHSYTAPPTLSGAPLSLLKRSIWPASFTTWPNDDMPSSHNLYWWRSTAHSLPWMIVEEDENYHLNYYVDSGWSSRDILTNRHRGRTAIAHTDGSVGLFRMQRDPRQERGIDLRSLTAFRTYFELTDGRIVITGVYNDQRELGITHPVRFGYLRNALRVNLTTPG
jgi:prepilin-type N-terminal cleavage/methylation domain-containing protein